MNDIKIIGVVGAGAMGRGIAQIAAQAGVQVRLFDVQAEAVKAARTSLQEIWQKLVEKGRMTAEGAASALENVAPCASLEEMAGVDLVVEACQLPLRQHLALGAVPGFDVQRSPGTQLLQHRGQLALRQGEADRDGLGLGDADQHGAVIAGQ